MDNEEGVNRDIFDESAYVSHYPDVRRALEEGWMQSAWWHYEHHGRAEGRRAFIVDYHFDDDYYLRAYPAVLQELEAGVAADPRDHYLRIGKARGFLPHYLGKRVDDAAGLQSPFGGLWPDLANGADLLAGKLETGRLTPQQCELVQHWMQNGYVIMPGAVSESLVDRVVADMDRAYAGRMPMLRFECHELDEEGLISWQSGVQAHAAKAIDMHHFSPAAREMMFADGISEFLGLIFESKAFASQSLGFMRGSGQEGHQDSAYVPYTIPRQFAASWIALEDVTIGAGELFYYPGSHHFPDFLYNGRFKSIVEAERCGFAVDRVEVEQHVTSLQRRVKQMGLKKHVFEAKKGDVLIWHADLVHGGNPVSCDTTRKSFVTHYCPKRIAPLFSEHMSTDLYDHDGHLLTTQHYAKADFVE